MIIFFALEGLIQCQQFTASAFLSFGDACGMYQHMKKIVKHGATIECNQGEALTNLADSDVVKRVRGVIQGRIAGPLKTVSHEFRRPFLMKETDLISTDVVKSLSSFNPLPSILELKEASALVGDDLLQSQVKYCHNVALFMEALAKASAAALLLRTEEAKKITPTAVKEIENIKRLFTIVHDSTYIKPLDQLFEEENDSFGTDSLGSSFAISNMSGCFGCGEMVANLGKMVDSYVASRVETWEKHVRKLVSTLEGGCPTGWLPSRLLDKDESADSMRQLLFGNKQYQNVGPLSQELKRQTDLLTLLRGSVPSVPVDLLSDAQKIRKQGTEVVTYTFLTYILFAKAPKLDDLKVRGELVEDAMTKSEEKVNLDEKWRVYAKALKDNTDPSQAILEYAAAQ